LLSSISCSSVGNCSAVGSYVDNSGQTQGLLLTETADSWSPGLEASLPADAGTTNQFVNLHSVSCLSAGNCTAVGTYASTVGGDGLLLTETAGVWATGVEAVLPAGASDSGIESVSCSSVGNCAAVGSYKSSSGNNYGALVLTETAGSWATGVEVPLPADAATSNQNAGLSSVSCPSDGNCTAVGGYLFMSGPDSWASQGLMVTETAGTWGAGVASSLPADASTPNPQGGLGSVSCAAAGDCTAGGGYTSTAIPGQEGLLLDESGGTWSSGITAPLPANAGSVSGPIYSLGSVSCASAGNCADAGSYFDDSSNAQGLLLTETAGSWAATEAALPSDAIVDRQFVIMYSASCASVGNCTAVGNYDVGVNQNTGVMVSETGGTWTTGVESVLPANAGSGPPEAGLDSVSCTPDGGCGAVGTYVTVSGTEGLLMGNPSPVVKLDVSESGTGAGTVSSGTPGIACGSTCSASFDAGTSVTLSAAAASGSTFAGWSGGGCSGTGNCVVTMSAAQSVTATFNTVPRFALSVSRAGTGTGTVTSSPAGIDCGGICSAKFDEGTSVTLTAVRAGGSTFAGWSGGGCSGTGTCVVTMTSDQAVTATFNQVHMLTVSVAGPGFGTITSSPAGINCGAIAIGTYSCTNFFSGQVTLTATPSASYVFEGWSGAGCSGTGTCVVKMGADQTATATFADGTKPPPTAKCVVPKVTGKSLKAAEHAIKADHCKVGKITRAFSSKVKKGKVISQKPKPHKRLMHNAKVSLLVSKGRHT
jgi:hypothetical protein